VPRSEYAALGRPWQIEISGKLPSREFFGRGLLVIHCLLRGFLGVLNNYSLCLVVMVKLFRLGSLNKAIVNGQGLKQSLRTYGLARAPGGAGGLAAGVILGPGYAAGAPGHEFGAAQFLEAKAAAATQPPLSQQQVPFVAPQLKIRVSAAAAAAAAATTSSTVSAPCLCLVVSDFPWLYELYLPSFEPLPIRAGGSGRYYTVTEAV
jgi:hypothetical protein